MRESFPSEHLTSFSIGEHLFFCIWQAGRVASERLFRYYSLKSNGQDALNLTFFGFLPCN